MLNENIASIFLSTQLLYLIYLILTNVSSMIFITVSLKSIANYFFAGNEIVCDKIINSNNYLPVSILVPAYNEEQTIVASIMAQLQLYFPEYEVIVINDGSSDGTLQTLIDNFGLEPAKIFYEEIIEHNPIKKIYKSKKYDNLIVIDKVNGGKADGLNAAINVSKHPLFCCVDADSLIEYDSVLRSIAMFSEDRGVIAVGGKIGILNGSRVENNKLVERLVPNTLIETFQILEYSRGFLAGRTAWDEFGSLLIISGAFGIFKKDLVKKIGGYRHTIGEDFDLLMRMYKYCYENNIKHSTHFVPDTVCWTQCPADYQSLMKQRNRWHRGLLETLYFNRSMILNPKFKKIGMIGIPYFILIEALSPIITFLGVISIIVLYLFNIINKDAIVIFFLLEFAWGAILNIGSMSLELFVVHRFKRAKDIFKILIVSFIEPFYYRPLLKIETFLATFNFMNSSWGQVKRKTI